VIETGDHPFLILSLCDLYAEVGAWDEIVDVASGVTNEDDVSLQVRLIQARAFREKGMDEAALEAYKDALRSKKRDPELLREVRYERAELYLASGKKAQGRKELERIYAEDAQFRDVAELLRAEDRAAPGNSA
jgi:predicted Zn-dependent protease